MTCITDVFVFGKGFQFSVAIGEHYRALEMVRYLYALRSSDQKDDQGSLIRDLPFALIDEEERPAAFVVPSEIMAVTCQMRVQDPMQKKHCQALIRNLNAQSAYYESMTKRDY
jgi:hypothetical protein